MMLKSSKVFSRFLLSNSNRLMFSANQEIKPFKFIEEKAYLASKIVELISQSDIQQNSFYSYEELSKLMPKIQAEIRKKSLAKRLVEMIHQQKVKKNLDKQVVDYMESFFTTGVQYDDEVFNQERMSQGAKFSKDDPQQRKFKFLPTYTVTSSVFNSIIYNNQQIITGHYGISKSISVMLYGMLSGIIAEYKIALRNSDESRLKDYIKSYPKLLYFNYMKNDPIITNSQNNLKIYSKGLTELDAKKLSQQIHDKFMRQCGLNGGENGRQFFIKQDDREMSLKKYYEEKGIQIIGMFDQFNSIVQLR